MTFFKKKCDAIQGGAALVEFAIVLPVLLLLLVGILEFSFAFYHLNILNKSVQDGARYFSNPKIAKNGDVGSLIDTRVVENAANIKATRSLIITSGTGTPLMSGSYSPAPAFYCSEECTKKYDCVPADIKTVLCANTTQHVTVTATYNHNFILGKLLSALTGGAIPSSYAFTASSTMRVP